MSAERHPRGAVIEYAGVDVRPLTAFETFAVSPLSWRQAILFPLVACVPLLLLFHRAGGLFFPQSYDRFWILIAPATIGLVTLLVVPYFVVRAAVRKRFAVNDSASPPRIGPAVTCAFLLYVLPIFLSFGGLPWVAFQFCRPQFEVLKAQAQAAGGTPVVVEAYVGPFYVSAVQAEMFSDAVIVQLSQNPGDGGGFYWNTDGLGPCLNLNDAWPLIGDWYTFSTD